MDGLIQRSAHEKPERPLWLSNTVLIMIKIALKWTCVTGVFEKSPGHTGILNILEKLIQNKSKKYWNCQASEAAHVPGSGGRTGWYLRLVPVLLVTSAVFRTIR